MGEQEIKTLVRVKAAVLAKSNETRVCDRNQVVRSIIVIESTGVHNESIGNILEVWSKHIVFQWALVVIHTNRLGKLLDCLT